jgi:hypothetical protein
MFAGKKSTQEGYGNHVFYGEMASPYLKAQGLCENVLESSGWTSDGSADKVSIFSMNKVCTS